MSALSAAAFYTGISLLLLFLLPVRVVAGRMRTRVSPGSGSDPDPELRIRAHGNAAGFIPASMPGLVVLALLTPPVWAIHVPGGVTTLGRLLHAAGLSASVLRARQFGMLVTWLGMSRIGAFAVCSALV